MTKLAKYVWTLTLLLALFCVGVFVADKQVLKNDLIRLHVIANSDSEADQSLKLSVRDAVITHLQKGLQDAGDTAEAKQYIQEQLEELEQVANVTLQTLGSQDNARVFLTKEAFALREYETFSLPSGVYESLRIEIGSAEGKNWWCVVFPSLCLPATVEEFRETAVLSGFDQGLANTLSGEHGYEIRFFFLDCLGKLENLFFPD